ncbi:MAG: hypothetical protein GWP08_12925 [Nitrospiraceae bacterium]|nr:hypothetical protein [Nitrospiraceae bacterium]
MTLPNMREETVSREYLRIAGGYGAQSEGQSPEGGLDVDNAGNLATDGDATIRGIVSAGSTPQAITNTSGELDGARIATGTVGATQLADGSVDTPQLADDAVTPAKLDSSEIYEMNGLKLVGAWDGIDQQTGGTGHLRIGSDTSTIRFASTNTSSQTVECFRTSSVPGASSAASFLVYNPGTTTVKHRLQGDGYASHSGDLYVGGNVSAASFTDRSPVYTGKRALAILQAIRPLPDTEGRTQRRHGDAEWADVDHDTLGPIRVERDTEEGPSVERDLNIQIQLLTGAVLELLTRLEAIEEKPPTPRDERTQTT